MEKEALETYQEEKTKYENAKTTEEDISNERLMNVLIDTLAKLSFKFKSYTGRILKCFIEIKRTLSNTTLLDKINEMMIQFENSSIQTEYLI